MSQGGWTYIIKKKHGANGLKSFSIIFAYLITSGQVFQPSFCGSCFMDVASTCHDKQFVAKS